MGRRNDIDWDAIERDYRLGQLTLRQLEAKHGVGFATIDKKAKKQGWTRDLSTEVRATTKALLQQQAQQTVVEGATESLQNDYKGVASAAELNRQVINSHRQDIADMKALVRSLMAEVTESATISKLDADLVAALVDTSEDKDGDGALSATSASLLLKRLREATGMPSRVSASKALAEALSKLIALERQAFSLDEKEEASDDSFEASLARAEEIRARLRAERAAK